MAASLDERLCNGIPIDHRLREFLPKAKPNDSRRVGNHAEIVEGFGRTMVRRDGTKPSADEAAFAGWLAKPGTTGGLVIALLQPAKTQNYTLEFQKVKDECATLAYVDQALKSIVDPRGLVATSVFDAFPFVIDTKSPEVWFDESKNAYATFLAMLEAKKPKIVFACWRVKGRGEIDFSGKGVGHSDEGEPLKLSNGHVVRVVNGFHPSVAANYYPNESCFRKLFTLELCKAFCELNSVWKEDIWMNCLRWRCKDRMRKLMEEQNGEAAQQENGSGRVLRSSKLDESKKKYNAYKSSFDNGLQCIKQIFEHLVPSEDTTESSWDLYNIFRNQNTSEGLCDALLAVYEVIIRFKPDPLIPDPSPAELRRHISRQARNFVKDDVPSLLNYPKGLNKNLWRSQISTRRSYGLRLSLEKVTIKFFEDVVDTFPEKTKSYYPTVLHAAFQEFTISFEESLGEQYDSRPRKSYDERQQIGVGSPSKNIDGITSGVSSMSISNSKNGEPTTPARNTISTRSLSSAVCSKCGGPGHNTESCKILKNGSTTPPRRYSTSTCYNCNEKGHWAKECLSPKKQRQSFGKCFKCDEVGHYANACPR